MTTALHGTVSERAVETTSYLDDDWRWRYARGACLRLTAEPQGLFDDYLVEDTFNLRRVIARPKKHPNNPIMVPDQPWEWRGHGGRILYDDHDGLFKMWYSVSRPDGGIRLEGHAEGFTYLQAYAVSRDGIHWEKPALDFVRFEGRRTNLLEPGRAKAAHVDFNPDQSDPRRRFIMTYRAELEKKADGAGRGYVAAYSPDGLHWKDDPQPLVFGAHDGGFSPIYDPQRQHWLVYRRAMTRACIRAYGPWHNLNRRPAVCIGKDIRSLGQAQVIRILDELDIDLADADGWKVWRWGDMFVGSLGVMDHFAEQPKREHLIFSRDGLNWQRLPHRPPFLELGEPGHWDAGEAPITHVMTCGPKVYIYYGGASGPQGDVNRSTALGVATLPRDRWVAQVADERGGFLLTRRFLNEGQELIVNAPTRRKHGGVIIAEVLKPSQGRDHLTAQPYPGFSFADCDPNPYKGGSRLVMRWKGSSISELRGKPVMLRFHLQHMALYTLTLEDSVAGASS
jgi:hypothetical protein